MPTSDFHNITPVMSLISNLNPKRMLDIGCGFGKYGMLVREYLDVWHERLTPSEWQVHIEGVEAFEKYKNPNHAFAYNHIHYCTAQEAVPKLGQFDLVLIADMIEHVELDVAQKLVKDLFEKSPIVIISTPRDFYPQKDAFENTYEVHRCHFKAEHYPPNVTVRTIRAVSCDIFVGSRQPLDKKVFTLTDPVDYLYLRSRKKLGTLGIPLSLGLRALARLLS